MDLEISVSAVVAPALSTPATVALKEALQQAPLVRKPDPLMLQQESDPSHLVVLRMRTVLEALVLALAPWGSKL
jgi:hypothetical protein